jgi:CzcA family heavy metal efflux pump
MLKAIISFSLHHRGVIITLACVLALYGLYRLNLASYDVFPEFAPPQVVVQTEAPGLAPEQVEQLITQPIENAVNGVSGTKSLRSSSIQGLSVITVTFDPGVDIYRARQMISERLTTVAVQLPVGIQTPAMNPLTSSTSVVMIVGLTSDTLNLMDLRTIADWTVKQRLLAVPGVSKVAVFGGEPREIQIQVIPERLTTYNVAIGDIFSAAQKASGIRGAGFIENDNQRIVLQARGQTTDPAVVAEAVVRHTSHGNVTIGDVARVVNAPEPLISAATIMGRPGVHIEISSQYGANTLMVTRSLEQALEELTPTLRSAGVDLHTDIFRPADFIDSSLRNVRSSLIIGAILVTLVLLLFLFNLRTAAISIAAIPLSLLTAVIALEYLGLSLNTMTLGGFAIAIGLIVDDAVIDVENVFRRLRENQLGRQLKPTLQLILDASIEVRSSIVYATLAIALVFVPVLTMSGVTGRLFAPLGIAFILSILASLLVAVTVTPALCYLLLPNHSLREPPWTQWIKRRYGELLLRVEKRPRTILVIVTLFTIAGLAMLPFFGGDLLPELQEGHYIVHMAAVPGTSLNESQRLGERVTRALLSLPAVKSVSQRVGRAELGDDVLGTQDSEFDVSLKALPTDEAESVPGSIRKVLAGFPGVNFSVNTFLTERVEETVSGFTAAVVVRVFGDDLDVLDTKAQNVAQILNTVPGATDVQVQSPPGTPELTIRIRPEDATFWGLNSTEVLDAIEAAYSGEVAGQIYQGNRVFDIAVILESTSRSISEIGSLPLKSPSGTTILLHQVADIFESSGRYSVLHDGARRMQAVTCNVAGRDVKSFVAEAQKKVQSSLQLPAGTYVQFGGAAEEQSRSRNDLLVHSAIAGLGIVLLLSLVLNKARNLLLILVNLPLALVGGVLAVFFTGGWLSIGSLVGFVTLFGITLRNSILMLSHYEHLVTVEGFPWNLDTAVRGAIERFTPILMTALVTGLGLLPLAIASGSAGREIEGPMAIVILGGLVTSTFLNLLLLPTLSLRYGDFTKREAR